MQVTNMSKVIPAPAHYFSFECDTCKFNSKLFVNPQPAIPGSRRHICDDKKVTVFHHIHYYGDVMPVKEIWGLHNV